METLLARIHSLNSIFRQKLFQDITLPDVSTTLSSVIDGYICFCLPEGDILHLNDRTGLTCEDVIKARVPGFGLERYTMGLSGPLLNKPVDAPFCLLPPSADSPVPFSFFPAYGDGSYLACLVVWHPEGHPLSMEDAILCEITSSILGMVCCRAKNKNDEWERIQISAAQVAVSVLSYSEYNAAKEIFRHIKNGECMLVVSQLAKDIFITRSIISSALKKLESSEIIVVRSMGTKGTYIRVINPFIFSALDSEAPLIHSHYPAKFSLPASDSSLSD